MTEKEHTHTKKSIHINMFGRLSMVVDGHELVNNISRSLKLWNVLCYLIMNRDRAVFQSELLDMFWSNDEIQNPVSALKTLIFRIRSQFETILPPDINPILSKRGAYIWNPDIKCVIDADIFENLCIKTENPSIKESEKVKLYKQALDIYNGDFLPILSTQMWVIPWNVRYNNLYFKALKDYSEILYKNGEYSELYRVCSKANKLHPLDESVNIWLIRAILKNGKVTDALRHYEKTVELIYKNLGVRPSDEFYSVYKEITEHKNNIENDIISIKNDLKKHCTQCGVFTCDYSLFRELYCLESRRAKRTGCHVHIALLSISKNSEKQNSKTINTVMDNMKSILNENLRKGDVVSRYSGSQYIIMLPLTSQKNAVSIMERIIYKFKICYKASVQITYKIELID